MKSTLLNFFLLTLLSLGCAMAHDYCPAMPKPKKEGGPWYIPESAFTKEAATKAIKDLNAL